MEDIQHQPLTYNTHVTAAHLHLHTWVYTQAYIYDTREGGEGTERGRGRERDRETLRALQSPVLHGMSSRQDNSCRSWRSDPPHLHAFKPSSESTECPSLDGLVYSDDHQHIQRSLQRKQQHSFSPLILWIPNISLHL